MRCLTWLGRIGARRFGWAESARAKVWLVGGEDEVDFFYLLGFSCLFHLCSLSWILASSLISRLQYVIIGKNFDCHQFNLNFLFLKSNNQIL